jgi:hypothetical protein
MVDGWSISQAKLFFRQVQPTWKLRHGTQTFNKHPRGTIFDPLKAEQKDSTVKKLD